MTAISPNDGNDIRLPRWLFVLTILAAIIFGAFMLLAASDQEFYDEIAKAVLSFMERPGRMALAAFGFTMFIGVLAATAFGPSSATHRAGVIIMLGIPTCTMAFIGLSIPGEPSGSIFVRSVFVATAVVLPAALFFLFIATRRESLLNSYLVHLDRLGLLARRRLGPDGIVALYVPAQAENDYEPEAVRIHRVRSYLDRFSAAYGRLPSTYVDNIIAVTNSQTPLRSRKPFSDFRPTLTEFELKTILPVLTATMLIVIGWISVLPALDSPPIGKASNLWWFDPTQIAPTGFAFLGAYFFSLQSIVRRYLRRDLGPNAYVSMSMRIVLSVIAAWLVVAIWRAYGWETENGLIGPAAFIIGIFPYVLW